jgi:hypothetical protein
MRATIIAVAFPSPRDPPVTITVLSAIVPPNHDVYLI